MEYWLRVLEGALAETIHPLGWGKKQLAIVLTAIGTIGGALFHFGWAAMIETAAGLAWLAFPPVFAALVLFVTGAIQTQAKLYRELTQSTGDEIKSLQGKLTKYEDTRPNYEALRHKERMEVRTAAT